MSDYDLRHHGDAEATEGLLDFAVNVRLPGPPPWLHRLLTDSITALGRYPDVTSARRAVASRHGRGEDEVLATAGAAEAFVLLARALRPRLAAVVHPSFTEPEAALRAAGHPVQRVQLEEADGFRLDPSRLPAEADLVVLGNPTNPTSVLHPASVVASLTRPGRVVVVDEAFMDCVPGEPESLAASRQPGLVVLRSLTKTWGLAGLRVGYLLGPPDLVTRLAAAQPLWSVSTPAAVALQACSSPPAVAEAAQAAQRLSAVRSGLAADLGRLPSIRLVPDAAASFLLARVTDGARVREHLRADGIAVRRGDTFPGLGPDWLRFAVRDAASNAVLVEALRRTARAVPTVSTEPTAGRSL